MIYLIGVAPQSHMYQPKSFEEFKQWALSLTEYELDIETDVVEHWSTKKVITIQLGYKDIQWVLQVSKLTPGLTSIQTC